MKSACVGVLSIIHNNILSHSCPECNCQ